MSEPPGLALDQLQSAIGVRYRVEHQIGAGGMATVYAAEDKRHARRVAIKVLRPDLASTLGAERFLREIAIAARLQHPHILGLIDSGAASGVLYYVMPLVEGVSLRTRLAREGELPIDEGLRLLREILDALAHAHEQRIVHRDLKPENVMLAGHARGGGRCHAMVADFGIAKAITDAAHGSTLTATSVAMGTPAYMSPEQAAGDPHVDHRSDLYAIGVLAYEMLAGAPPFGGATAQQIIAGHMTRTPESIVRRRPSVPPEVDAFIMRALEKRPADRWQTAEDMLSQLETIVTASRAPALTPVPRPETIERGFRLTENVCRRLDRATLDPSIIGGEMRFLDNQAQSDVLVFCIHGTGQDHSVFGDVVAELPYRTVAPTFVGFEPGRRQRPALSLTTHIGLLRELLRAMVDEMRASAVVIVGFSAGGDAALRLVADAEADLPRVHGLISLGCNLSFATCFVTRVFMQLGAADESGLLEGLRHFGTGAQSLEEWIKVHEYLVNTFRKFGHEVEPVRRFSQDVVRMFEQRPDTFRELYLSATARVPVVRCLWEDAPNCIRLVQDLRLRNLDDPSVLGEHYRGDSLVIQAGAGHFDLIKPPVWRPHLDAAIEAARTGRTAS